jgi:hypothetical protein
MEKSPFLMGKSTINDHFQQQTVSLPEGTKGWEILRHL